MNGRHLCVVLVMCGGWGGEAAATERPGFVQDMRQVLATRGPKGAVAEMNATGDWGRFIARVSSGDIGAIDLARELAKGTDAGTSEDLTISLAEALPKAPRNVLAALEADRSGPLSYSRVCTAPFIEDTSRHQREYKAAALKAITLVSRNRDPDLLPVIKLCRAELRKVKG